MSVIISGVMSKSEMSIVTRLLLLHASDKLHISYDKHVLAIHRIRTNWKFTYP